jgi:excinuclease ABC subunit B
MEGARNDKNKASKKYQLKVAESGKDYSTLSAIEIMKEIDRLEKKMYQHAQDLEFEEAGRLRDFIKELQEQVAFAK